MEILSALQELVSNIHFGFWHWVVLIAGLIIAYSAIRDSYNNRSLWVALVCALLSLLSIGLFLAGCSGLVLSQTGIDWMWVGISCGALAICCLVAKSGKYLSIFFICVIVSLVLAGIAALSAAMVQENPVGAPIAHPWAIWNLLTLMMLYICQMGTLADWEVPEAVPTPPGIEPDDWEW